MQRAAEVVLLPAEHLPTTHQVELRDPLVVKRAAHVLQPLWREAHVPRVQHGAATGERRRRRGGSAVKQAPQV